MKDALVFCYDTFVLANPANQPAGNRPSFFIAVPRVANLGVTEVKPGADGAGVNLDAILCQRPSL